MTDKQVIKSDDVSRVLSVAQASSDLAGQVPELEMDTTSTALDPSFMEKCCVAIVKAAIDKEGTEALPNVAEALEKVGCTPELWVQMCEHPDLMSTLRRVQTSLIVMPRMPSMLLAQTRLAQAGDTRAFGHVKEIVKASSQDDALAKAMDFYQSAGPDALVREAQRQAEALAAAAKAVEPKGADQGSVAEAEAEAMASKKLERNVKKVDHNKIWATEDDAAASL